jgi:hypothetical protein
MKYKSLFRKIISIGLLLMIGHTGFSQLVIGVIPKGDSIVIRHDVTIIASPPAGTNHIANQWTIKGSNFSNFVTDDPDTVTPLDSTLTVLVLCPTIAVTNPAVTTGNQGSLFSQTFTASGGTTPYTFTTASSLPVGLTLSTAGVLSGIPTVIGTYPIVVTATDAGSCAGNGPTYNLVISCITNTWAGTTSTNWFNPANWTCGVVPTATSDVVIQPIGGAVVYQPVIAAGTANVHNLTIQSSASLTNNGTLTIGSGGIVTNSGTFTNNGTFNQ